MNGRNAPIAIIIAVICAVIIFYMMYVVRKIDVGLGGEIAQQKTEELTDALNELDYQLYWIGYLPPYMEGIEEHVTLLTAGQANGTTLPVTEGDVGFTAYDPDGNVISRVEQRDYADHMMIVINTTDDISDATWSVIQDCAVNNHVPVLLIGRHNIDAFREHMILIHREYDDYSTMFFEISRTPVEDPIAPDIVRAGGRELADALLEYIRASFDDPSVVYVTPPVSTTETQETEITEETADAA